MQELILVETLMGGKYLFHRDLDADAFISYLPQNEQSLIIRENISVFDGPLSAYDKFNEKTKVKKYVAGKTG